MRYIPERSVNGGSLAGNTYVSTFAKCPRQWFNNWYRPTEVEGVTLRGIRLPYTSRHLLLGSEVHEGLRGYYLSGCRDGEDTGEYSLDKALALALECHEKHLDEYQEPAVAEECHRTATHMLTHYAEVFGPEGESPDYPGLKVVCDEDGEPLVEKELRAELGGGYIFTVKADVVVEHRGYLKVMEHKTSHPRYVTSRISSANWDSQMTGECWVPSTLWPERKFSGVLMNVLPKRDKLPKTTSILGALRETATRTPAELARFQTTTRTVLEQIDSAVEGFEYSRSLGLSVERSADVAFPDLGTRTGECFSYNSPCEFFDLCKLAGREEAILKRYQPRATEEVEEMKKWTGG